MFISWQMAALLLLGGSTALLFLGMPVALSFIAINIIGAALYLGGDAGLLQIVRNSVVSVMNFSLTPIPLFILMGEVLFHTGLALSDLGFLLKGAGLTVAITVVAVLFGTLLGVVFGTIKAHVGWLAAVPLTFVLDVLRSVPLLIQLILVNNRPQSGNAARRTASLKAIRRSILPLAPLGVKPLPASPSPLMTGERGQESVRARIHSHVWTDFANAPSFLDDSIFISPALGYVAWL